MNGESLAEYQALLARRRPARPFACERRLGHLRRRQHGRHDPVHGDARARRRAPPCRLRRQRRAARLRPLSLHRGRRGGGRAAACSTGGSSTPSPRGSTTPRSVRRRRRRTRCVRTSSSTRRWVREAPAVAVAIAPEWGRRGARVLRRASSGARRRPCCRSSTRVERIMVRRRRRPRAGHRHADRRRAAAERPLPPRGRLRPR